MSTTLEKKENKKAVKVVLNKINEIDVDNIKVIKKDSGNKSIWYIYRRDKITRQSPNKGKIGYVKIIKLDKTCVVITKTKVRRRRDLDVSECNELEVFLTKAPKVGWMLIIKNVKTGKIIAKRALL